MKKAVFIERDGILNEYVYVGKKPTSPTSVVAIKRMLNTLPELEQLKKMGFLIIVTTNQPKVSEGTLPRGELDRMHDLIRYAFPSVDDILVCRHTDSDCCPCRKPLPGLFVEAAFKWHLDLKNSFVISDKWQDAKVAETIECTSYIINSPHTGKHRGNIVDTFATAVKHIVDASKKQKRCR